MDVTTSTHSSGVRSAATIDVVGNAIPMSAPPAKANHSKHQNNDAAVDDIETGTSNAAANRTASPTANTNATEHEIIQQSIKDNSFIDHLKFIVELKSDTVFSTWYNDKGKAINNYTFQQLWDEAGQCAHLLRNKWDVKKGDRVVLCYDFGLHFFAIFLGCLRAGVTAVLVYPPGPPLVKSLAKMNKVIEDCSPAVILTQTTINLLRLADRANPASKSRSMWPSGVKYQVTDRVIHHDPFLVDRRSGKSKAGPKQAKKGFLSSLLSGRSSSPPPSFDEPNIQGSDLAFLQYTSGSTGNPKGVMVTYDAVRANIELLHSSWLTCFDKGTSGKQLPERFSTFSWLPQYHDMGLIQMVIAPLASSSRVHMISPVSFIRNPLLWVDLMSQHKCHFSAAPDFAFRLVVRKFNEAKTRAKHGKSNPIPNLDLSSIFELQNAAEPIRLDTNESFSKAFCPHGLCEDWFMAGYGLAENVVGASFNFGFHLSTVRPDEDLHPFVAIAQRSNLHSLVDIIIVDPDTCSQVSDNVTGEIWIAGASVAAGYYNQPQLTAETFQGRLQETTPSDADADSKVYLRTGDYGFYQDDYLYICGRKKDIIIVNGVNYYPQDIEQAVEDASSAVRPGCIAAFSSDDTDNDGQLEIVFEIRSADTDDVESICQQIKKAVVDQIGLTPASVVAVEERTISKTTSGKIQRRHNRQRLHDGTQKIVLDVAGTSHFFSAHDVGTAAQSSHLSLRKSAMEDWNINDMDFHEIIENVTRSGVHPDDEWKDVGLSSMMELELRQSLSQRYNKVLPSNVFQLFPKVVDLRAFLEASTGLPLPTNLPTLKRLVTFPNEKPLSQAAVAITQAIGAFIMLVIFALPIIPAYEVGKAIADSNVLPGLEWVLFPLIVPVWAIAFTSAIVLSKWIVIGRYAEGYANQTNIYFIRWWFVDRLVHVWERFVGCIIAGTPLMMMFYYLMGANIHRSASVNGTIREFDLVKIGANATINMNIRCRVFGPWRNEQQGPSVKFRKIQVGSDATVDGALLPGTSIGSGCQVQRVSVLVEGAQAPPNTTIKGNPAFVDAPSAALPDGDEESAIETASEDMTSATSTGSSTVLGMMKVMWLAIELYFAFSCFVAADQLVGNKLPEWRYSPIIYRIALFGLTSIFFVITSVILKWVLIGKKRPGAARTGTFSKFADWACNFHFFVGTMLLLDLTFYSQLWNLVLMAHGMDIDMRSRAGVTTFPPSKLDLITVRRSFISFCDFDVEEGGQYKRTKVTDSSVGMALTCGPGVTIDRSLVLPSTHVTSDMINEDHHPSNVPLPTWRLALMTVNNTLAHAIMVVIVAASLIPSYELMSIMMKTEAPLAAAPVIVVVSIVVQAIVWLVLLRVIEVISLIGGVQRGEPWSVSLYSAYMSYGFFFEEWSFESILWGTPMMNALLQFRGATIQGKMLYFGFRIYEAPLVTFADGAVVDEGIITGHYGVFSTLSLGKCYVDGVMHQMSFALMRKGAATQDAALMEHSPWKMVSDIQPPGTKQPLSMYDGSSDEEA